MNPASDTTAVNPEPAKRVPTLFPDPMNPHSLYNPNEDPKNKPDANESSVEISRR